MPDYQQHERFGVHYLRPTSRKTATNRYDAFAKGMPMLRRRGSPTQSARARNAICGTRGALNREPEGSDVGDESD